MGRDMFAAWLLCLAVSTTSLQDDVPRMAGGNLADGGKAPQIDASRSGSDAYRTRGGKKNVKPPTYNVPLDEVVRRDRLWMYRDSSLTQIPIPRAPIPTFGEVIPRPQTWLKNETFFVVLPNLRIAIHSPSNHILTDAVSRYELLIGSCAKLSTHPRQSVPRQLTDSEVDIIFSSTAQKHFQTARHHPHWSREAQLLMSRFPGIANCSSKEKPLMAISCIRLVVRNLGGSWPSQQMNESYSLMAFPSGITILAEEVWGALRGLETLSQLLWCSPSGSTIFINQTIIEDYPSFAYRGLHLDTSRHYISKANILINLETMAFNKLNVFHWHLTDDQSFPFVSETFPELSKEAAYHSSLVYTHADVREIVQFARVRGIRVIPEFDIPGHTRSWSLSHPEIFAKCYEMNEETVFYGGLDPSKNETLNFLVAFFKEIVELFPDDTLHMGFDEVEFECWSSNPTIQNYMTINNLRSPLEIFKVFAVRLFEKIQESAKNVALTGRKRFIFWQEAFENGLKVPDNSIIHIWKDVSNMPDRFDFEAVVSTGWYLDSYLKTNDWVAYYQNIIYPLNLYSKAQASPDFKKVIGGEACMWIEWQSDETVIQRIWPVTSAIAERLWYYKTPDADEFGPRLEEQRCRLLRRGVPVGVASGPGTCPLIPGLDIIPFRDLQNGTVLPNSACEHASCIGIGKILIVFCSLLFFCTGYFVGRLSLATRLSLTFKMISARAIHRLPRYSLFGPLVGLLAFIAIAYILLTHNKMGTF